MRDNKDIEKLIELFMTKLLETNTPFDLGARLISEGYGFDDLVFLGIEPKDIKLAYYVYEEEWSNYVG